MDLKNYTTCDYKKIILEDISLIDVRSPIEFEKGAFKNAVNLPLMNNEERKQVGICYKQEGHDNAVSLGNKLVSGEKKQRRINKWISFIEENPNCIIYCFRGGLRSQIAQQWLYDKANIKVPRLEKGYKDFRNFLIKSLEPENYNSNPIVLGGHTGSNKTIILNNFDFSIDLEALANHRGSSFGGYITDQPTQINFENNLAFDLIKHEEIGYKYMLLEDEGKHIGKSFIPKNIRSFFDKAPLIVVSLPVEERAQNICNEYVKDAQQNYLLHFGEQGWEKWYKKIENSIKGIKKRLGAQKCKEILNEFYIACDDQKKSGSYSLHDIWIKSLLQNYYDPMYSHQIKNTHRKIIFEGNSKEVIEYIKSLK